MAASKKKGGKRKMSYRQAQKFCGRQELTKGKFKACVKRKYKPKKTTTKRKSRRC